MKANNLWEQDRIRKLTTPELVEAEIQRCNIYLEEHAKRIGLKWKPYAGVFDGEGYCLAAESEEEVFRAQVKALEQSAVGAKWFAAKQPARVKKVAALFRTDPKPDLAHP